MFLLDTDHISILQRRASQERDRLVRRMATQPTNRFYFSIVSFHEQLLGANVLVQRAHSREKLLKGYDLFRQLLADYGEAQVLAYDARAEDVFVSLRKQKVRIGTMDLRIAAIALTHSFTVLTRNVSDFDRVPGLGSEDWTV